MRTLFVTISLFFASSLPLMAQENGIFKDVEIEKFSKLMNAGSDYILIDVRKPEEVKNGMIKGAIHIDYFGDDFKSEIDKLDKSKKVLVYCASGRRSGKTMEMMKEMGFREVYNLLGGYNAWSKK